MNEIGRTESIGIKGGRAARLLRSPSSMLDHNCRLRGAWARASLALLALGVFAAPSVAFAHLDIMYPPMRGGNQKAGPCEALPAPSEPTTVLAPGSELSIQITETIPHPGHFRIMLDTDVNDGENFPAPVNCDDVGTPDGVTLLGDNLLPAQGFTCPGFHTPSERTPTRNQEYEFTVTLPDVECDHCVLQIIQVMTDEGKADPDGNWDPAGGKGLYFRCADIQLSNSVAPTPEPEPTPEPGPEAPTLSGGCSASGSNGGPLTLALLAMVGLVLARRRR